MIARCLQQSIVVIELGHNSLNRRIIIALGRSRRRVTVALQSSPGANSKRRKINWLEDGQFRSRTSTGRMAGMEPFSALAIMFDPPREIRPEEQAFKSIEELPENSRSDPIY